MRASARQFRLALGALALMALLLATAPLAVSPVRADGPGVYDARMQTLGERPQQRPPRSAQEPVSGAEPTPADVHGQAEYRADLPGPSLPRLADAAVWDDRDWVITAILGQDPLPGAIYTFYIPTDTLYGPHLSGKLGTPAGGVLDVAVTPDGSTALVSNFGDYKVFFVDLSYPDHPFLLGSVALPMFAEDIAITPDGKFALVTDGGSATQVASVNIATRSLVTTTNISPNQAQAVAVAPNGTVIVADFWNGQLHTLIIDGSGYLTPVASYQLPTVPKVNDFDWPINVAVAPDGETVLEITAYFDWVSVFRVTGPGTLAYVGRVEGLPPVWDEVAQTFYGGQQSVAFSADGTQAYVITNGRFSLPPESAQLPNQISVLDITAPGVVSLNTSGAATLLNHNSGQFYGVDVLAVADGKLYVGNPTTFQAVTYLQVVDLTDYSVSSLPVSEFPAGVAAFSGPAPGRRAVGGVTLPVSKLGLLTPWVGLIVAGGFLLGGSALVIRKRVG